MPIYKASHSFQQTMASTTDEAPVITTIPEPEAPPTNEMNEAVAAVGQNHADAINPFEKEESAASKHFASDASSGGQGGPIDEFLSNVVDSCCGSNKTA